MKDYKYQLIFILKYDITKKCNVKYFKNDTTLINFLMKNSQLIISYDITDMTNLKRVKYDYYS